MIDLNSPQSMSALTVLEDFMKHRGGKDCTGAGCDTCRQYFAKSKDALDLMERSSTAT